jgi:hypothetical protein
MIYCRNSTNRYSDAARCCNLIESQRRIVSVFIMCDFIFYSKYPGGPESINASVPYASVPYASVPYALCLMPQCLIIYSEYPERTRTSRGREPSEALTMPSFSIFSIMRAARL